MKLSSALVERTLTQVDAQAIPENHPVIPQLNSLFGDHTFFLDGNGLKIVEPAAPTTVSRRARWSRSPAGRTPTAPAWCRMSRSRPRS